MPSFLTLPYLPTSRVTHILGGAGMSAYEKALSALYITCIYTEPIPTIHTSVKAHADLAVFPFGGKMLILDTSQHTVFEALRALGAQPQYARRAVENGYPKEAVLNCVRIGNILLANPKTADNNILELCERYAVSLCKVRQGYTKCSVAVVSETALMTDDASVARVARDAGLDVLCVGKGSVQLQGYPYGFLGGCCALIAKDCMLFAGDVQMHENADAICAFLRNYQIYPEALSNTPLTDIGSFIPLLQQEER